MRRLAWILTFVCVASGDARAVPGAVTFTARIADNGTPLSGQHTFVFRLYDAETGGAELWSETHAGITVEDGLVYLELGSLDPLDDAILDGNKLFLEVDVGATTLSPRLPIVSVPYAVRAGNAETVGGFSPTDLVTSVTAGTGLSGGGTGSVSLSVDTASIQARVSGTCAAGSSIRVIASDGTVTCETDDSGGSSYTIGSGLSLSGTTLSASFTTSGGDNGTGTNVARGDHLHDGRYFTESELNAPGGTINAAGNPMEWSRLKGVPAGIADGTDADTTYSAGNGLSLSMNQFSVSYGGTGVATTVARSDHDHNGTYVRITGDALTGALTLSAGGGGGLNWPNDPYGGAGDTSWIRYIQDGAGEDTALQIGIANDGNDDIELYQAGAVRAGVENGVLYSAGNLEVRGASPTIVMGAHGGYSSAIYAGIYAAGADYSVLTDASNTFVNSASASGQLFLRHGNQDRLVVGANETGVHRPLIVRGCPASYSLDPDAPICVSSFRGTARWYDAQRDCIDEGAHICTAGEIYALAGAAAGISPWINGDWIGNTAGDDICLYVNNSADKNNFEGTANKADLRWYACCINVAGGN